MKLTLRIIMLVSVVAFLAAASGEDRLPGISNYFGGADPAGWITKVPNFARVRYENVYPGIDAVYYGNDRRLEYDFVVAPGTDPRSVALRFDGAESVVVAANGDLVVETSDGPIVQRKPVAYQTVTDTRHEVAVDYALGDDGVVRFAIGEYDPHSALVIDPVVDWATYLGGTGWETALDIDVDASGDVYVSGYTSSTDFPTSTGAYDTTFFDNYDAYVAKLDSTGTNLIYSTFLTGSGTVRAQGVAVNSDGEAFITGNAPSDFPVTTGSMDTTHNGSSDAFVARLSADGTSLDYSTFVGGTAWDQGLQLALDGSSKDTAYITGTTKSTDFPVTGSAYHSTTDGSRYDAFVAVIDTSLSGSGAMQYASFLGGSEYEEGYDIFADSSGAAYITGYTKSDTDFPVTSGVLQPTWGGDFIGRDAFVAKFDTTASGASSLVYSTYLGGDGDDTGNSIAADGSGNAYVVGVTESSTNFSGTTFPTTSAAIQTDLTGGNLDDDAFIAKLSPDGSSLLYGTYVGGMEYDSASNVALDSNGKAVVAGYTASTDFPLIDPMMAADAGTSGSFEGDAFLLRLDTSGSGKNAFDFATFLGGSDQDSSAGLAVDSSDNAILTGTTESSDLPSTSGTYQPAKSSHRDAFIARVSHTTPSGPGTLQFSAATFYVEEFNCDTAVVTVTRSNGSTGEVTVVYGTIGGGSTAAPNTDYIPQAGTLTFADGYAGTQSFGVPIFDTVDSESTETVNLAIASPTNGATLGSLTIAQLNIVDSTSAHNSTIQTIDVLNGDTRPCHESPFANVWIGTIVADPLGSWASDDPEDDGNRTGGSGSFFSANSRKIQRMDAILNAPVFDASNLSGATLGFATDFLTVTGQAIADVDVSVSGLKGPWTNVWTRTGDDLPGPSSQSVDISSLADGKAEVSVRFHYYNAFQDGWWQIDSIGITGQSTTPVPGTGIVALAALGATFAAGLAWRLRRSRVRP